MKLECRNLTKKYGDKRAVDEVSLVLESGRLRLSGRGWLLMDSVVTDVLNGYIPN